MNKEENKYYPDELTTEILDELWLDMSFHKDYIKHKYEFYKLRDTYCLLQQENKQLKEKIEKTIEYIKNKGGYCEEYKMTSRPFNTLELDDLLEILKGE